MRGFHKFSDARDRSVVLPVAALLKQYKENPQSTMIRHFDLLFIQQSIGKLSSKVCKHPNVPVWTVLSIEIGTT